MVRVAVPLLKLKDALTPNSCSVRDPLPVIRMTMALRSIALVFISLANTAWCQYNTKEITIDASRYDEEFFSFHSVKSRRVGFSPHCPKTDKVF